MKIKTVKKMNVLELAQAVRNGEFERGTYISFKNKDKVFFGTDTLGFDHAFGNSVNYSDYFEVKSLEKMTEGTKLPCNVVIVSSTLTSVRNFTSGESISVIKQSRKILGASLLYVYQQHSDGSIGKLIWSEENGFEDGLLEVSE